MSDREKVISTFEKIISVCKEDGCDFVDLTFEDAEQILAMLKEQEERIKKRDESLEKAREEIEWLRGMLKEQEAVEPRRIDGKRNHFIKCGNCNYDLLTGYMFCPHCGKLVKWNVSN